LQNPLDSLPLCSLKARRLAAVTNKTRGFRGEHWERELEKGESMGMKVFRQTCWALVATVVFSIAKTATAIYLDEGQTISLRSRVYSQASIRTEGSYDDTTPTVKVGQLVQHRNFFNPELEAKLASYTTWMRNQGTVLRALAPDSFDFRLAAWGFYDGIFDYGTQQFSRQRDLNHTRYSEAKEMGSPNNPGPNQVLRGQDETLEPLDVYGHQRRVNELYLSYTKGPLFVRFGKQAISWGESDTIAILDQNNPFDLTLGVPGVFEDLDEARIPLWTVRTSYALFDTWGPLSSGFVEAYWVPGDIDNSTATVPEPAVAPYSPPGPDPAAQAGPALAVFNVGDYQECGNPNANRPLCVVLVDKVPPHAMKSSRWGVRTQAVVARNYTVSAWIYTAFPNAPVPRLIGHATSSTLPFGQNNLFMIEFVHKLVPVIGISNTFFLEPLDGIIRMEAEYFNREPAFIPSKNLPQAAGQIGIGTCPSPFKQRPNAKDCIPQGGNVPHADFLRWELGYDRFFFFRPLNPTNSFTWITAFVGSYNLDETSKKDFYQNGQQKPGTYPVFVNGKWQNLQPKDSDFVQLPKVDMFVQSHLSTDYMHGRLTPNLLGIFNGLGTFVVQTQLTYRWSDSLIFDGYYTTIGGMFSGAGFFRDRDQLALRMTLQLN
jgi:hypothetical protein